jgi:uncharacterized membrane protein HdeD (DUF308 family)
MSIAAMVNFTIAVLFLTIPIACLLLLPGAVWRIWTRQRPRRLAGDQEARLIAVAFALALMAVALVA